jgi:hypothetical protein
LQVPDGPITKSKAKKIKEEMQGLVQSTWAEFAYLSSKTPTFNMGLKEEPALIHVIQALVQTLYFIKYKRVGLFLCCYNCRLLGLFISLSGLLLLAIEM